MSVIYKFSVERSDGQWVPAHLHRLLPDLEVWREYYVESAEQVDGATVGELADALIDPMVESVSVQRPLPQGAVQVAYQRGIVDNENDSITGLARIVGLPAVAAKVATVYRSDHPSLVTVIEAEACNFNIEELHLNEPEYETLMPAGAYAPSESVDLRPLDDDGLTKVGFDNGRSLVLDQMERIRAIQVEQGLEAVSDVMLEALDARWSDHCAHTTWKSRGNLLGRMIDAARATGNPNIVSMFHDNAGIWKFYDGHGIAIKAETHNGPTAVSAYFGQLTKVGGVLRDILGTGKGADPFGVFEYTATGLPGSPSPVAGRPSPKRIAHETIRAVKEYGNTFGVPMMFSHMTFHDEYRAKPFALGGSLGLIPLTHAEKGKPQTGDHVVLIGGLTGNDGIHGASASSAGGVMDTTSVQIGSPLEEIKFREAILELRDAGCVRAITDLGAAGLNSAVGEMGEDVGIWLNTALVPLKTRGLAMWRILLSESQERMLLAIAPDQLATARRILSRHEVRNAVVGRFTGNNRYCVVHDPALDEETVVAWPAGTIGTATEVGFDLPYEELSYRPPSVAVPGYQQSWPVASEWPELTPQQVGGMMASLLGDFELADQSMASSQYDSSVMAVTHYGPLAGGDVASGYWAGRPLYDRPSAVVFNTAFNPWLYEAHPVRAARQSLCALLTQQLLAGVARLDVCLCDNFYTPHLEESADSWLVGMVHELAELSEHFQTPFISGKDSSAGSVKTAEGTISVPPGVFLSALGKVPDAARLRHETLTGFGNAIVRIGLDSASLAGTVTARIFDLDANDVDDVSLEAVDEFFGALQELSLEVAPSGRLIGAGGVMGTAALMVMASSLGVALTAEEGVELLQEHRVGALIEVAADQVERLPSELRPRVIGHVTGDAGVLTVNGHDVLTEEAVSAWKTTFEKELA